MLCGLCGKNVEPGSLTCPGCQATYGPMLTKGLLAMFLLAYILLFIGFLATAEGLIERHILQALTIGLSSLAAGLSTLWLIYRKTPRGWRPRQYL